LKPAAITVMDMEQREALVPLAKLNLLITLALPLCLAATSLGVAQAQSFTPVESSPSQISPEEVENKRKSGSLLPGVRSSLSYSTNSSLENAGSPNRRSDFILEVTPYIRAESEAARFKYKLDYSISNLYRAKTGDSIIGRQRLQSNITAALAGDWLWVDGSGLIANTVADLFGPLSADPNTSFVNSSQIRTFSISPYIRSRLFGLADGTFRYGLQWTDTSRNTIEQSKFIHTLSSDIRGSEVDGRNWNWSWGGEQTRRTFGTENVVRNFAIGSAYWVPVTSVRLTGSVVYDQIDRLRARNGDTKGLGPGLGIDWNPLDNTRIQAQAIRRYYGNSINSSISQTGQFFVASLNYNKGAVGSVDSTVFSIDPGSVFSNGAVSSNPAYRALIAQNLRLGYGIPYSAGLIDDTYVIEQKLGASIGLIGVRNSLTFNLYRNERNTDLFITAVPGGGSGPRGGGVGISSRFNGIVVVLNGNMDYRYKFDSRTNLNIGLSHSKNESTTIGFSSRSTTLSAGLSTKLTADAQAGAGIRRTEGQTNGLDRSKFEDTSLYGTIDVRF
jgi:uncharacterized protein (PEP-CTERM system associated)